MTTLIHKIEKLIKREKTTPERKKKDDSTKSSSEILSELFSAFNADPPKIDEVQGKKSKKSKKKHKKDKKKRSRSSSSSGSNDSDYSHKRKKRKKSKTKKRKHSDKERSPSYSPPRTPISLTPDRLTPERLTPVRSVVKCEGSKNDNATKEKPVIIKEEPKEEPKKIKEESKKIKEEPKKIKEEPKKIKEEPKKIKDDTKKVKSQEIKKIADEEFNKTNEANCEEVKEEVVFNFEPKHECKSPKTQHADTDTLIEASDIPMPESPNEKNVNLHENDLRLKLENKRNEIDCDKSKGRIQIKNLKFSAVFEETVKKAEEERRKKAEKFEDGECTGSSSSSDKEEESNSHFPKTSDPGGILKMQAAEEKVVEVVDKTPTKKSKQPESSHKSSRRDRSRSRKRSRSKSKRTRSTSRKRRHRSRSKTGRSRHRSSSAKSHRSRHRSSSRTRRRSRSKSRHRSRHHGRRSRSPSGVKLADHEKKRLLEVARRNAINMLKNGAVPAGAAALPPHTRNQVMAAIHSGGKSVDELTDFCKNLSKKEALGELSSVSSNDENDENEDTIAFHHPFLVKEKPPIVLNIRGGAPLPVKTTSVTVANKEELRLQFPVSSGSQHREKALEWVPVSPKKDSSDMQVAKLSSNSDTEVEDKAEPEKSPKSGPLALPAPPSSSSQPSYLKSFSSGSQLSSVPALPAPGPQAYPPGADQPHVDMASIVSQKIARIRREQEENELSSTHGFGWSKDNSLGQFTGSTGAQILTPKELASGTQAWAKKDQLTRAAPVEGGMGMHLLQKMGWTPGQGLGKEGTGTLQPLLLEVKLDTKGLQAKEEVSSTRHSKGGGLRQHRQGRRGPAPLVAGGKHPVSLLGEYCSKQKLGPPEYNLCFECGPDHKKNFLFKVKVAGVEYQPAVASANKKQAKADAAQLALQKIGIVS